MINSSTMQRTMTHFGICSYVSITHLAKYLFFFLVGIFFNVWELQHYFSDSERKLLWSLSSQTSQNIQAPNKV